MLSIKHTSRFKRSYKKLSQEIQKDFIKKLEIFKKQPYHSTLKTHHLHGSLNYAQSFHLKNGFCVLFYFKNENTVILVNIGNHDDYKKWER